MQRIILPLLVLGLLATSSVHAQDSTKTPYGVTLLGDDKPADVELHTPAKFAAGLAVSTVTLGFSYYVTFASLGFLGVPMVPVYATTPFTTAAVVHGIGHRRGGEGLYRGAFLGSLAGTLVGTGTGALALFASGLGQRTFEEGLVPAATVVLTLTTALGATGGAVLGHNMSERRQRAARAVQLGGGVAPMREGGLVASVSGRF